MAKKTQKKPAKKIEKPAKKPAKAPEKKPLPVKKALPVPAKKPTAVKPAPPTRPAAREKGDFVSTWIARGQTFESVEQLFHEAAIFLRKNFGFTSLNLFSGSGSSPLLAVHHDGTSYVSENLDTTGHAPDAGTITKESKVFIIAENKPSSVSIQGSIASASVNAPGHQSGILVAASEDPAPPYLKSDLALLQSFAQFLGPVLSHFQLMAVETKNRDLSAELKETQKNARESQKTLTADSARKIEELTAEHESRLSAQKESLLAEAEEKTRALAEKLEARIEESSQTALRLREELQTAHRERDEAAATARKESQDRIAELELELDDLKSRAAEQKAAAIQEIETAAAAEKADLRAKLDAAEREKQSALSRTSALEANLEKIQKEAHDLRAEIEARDALLSETGSEHTRKEAQLTSQIEEIKKQHAAEKQKLENEKASILESKAAVEKALSDSHNQSESAVADLHKKIAALELRLREESEKAQKEIAFQEAKNREITSHLEDEKKKLQADKKKHEDELAREKDARAQRERELSEARNAGDRKTGELQTEITKRESQISSLKEEINNLNQEIHKRNSRIGEMERQIADQKNRIVSLEAEVGKRDNTIKKLEADLELARKESRRISEEKAEAQKQIKSLEELLLVRDRELKNQAEEIALRDEELARLAGQIQSLKENKESQDTRIAGLEKEIAHYRERESRLEKDIVTLQDEKRVLGGKIESQNEEIASLKGGVQKEVRERESVQAELASVRTREKKMSEELQSALNREKGSREEGVILFNFARALSETESFKGKLERLASGLSARLNISRIFAYSLKGEDLLLLEEALHGKDWLNQSKKTHIRVSETVMGNALASLKPDALQPGVSEIPEKLLHDILGSSNGSAGKGNGIVLPLTESLETLGALCIFADGPVGESDVRLLANLAPLMATALRMRLEERSRRSGKEGFERKNAIIHFLEKKLHKQGIEIDPARKPEEQLAAFEVFAHNLGRICHEEGIVTNLEIEPASLLALSDRITSPTHLHYILLEAVENVRAHAEATRLAIRLRSVGEDIALVIEDNGEGLLRKAGTENPAKGTGIAAIKNLAMDAGASVSMSKGAEGRGLRIECVWHSGPG
ncbi:MAG TPA: hypothetical protein PLG78_13115 [Leptospiraceae bacterium]|nr:hypothetical protein [Leptospiraceae bacterium]